MAIFNRTPHRIDVYKEDQFQGLEQINGTTFIADGVEGEGLAYPAEGMARVKVSTVEAAPIDGIPTVVSDYGAIEGLPDPVDGNYHVVSLLTVSAARANGRPTSDLLSPYKVVRDRANTSNVIGCMGFTRA